MRVILLKISEYQLIIGVKLLLLVKEKGINSSFSGTERKFAWLD